MTTSPPTRFACPACGERFPTDHAIKQALVKFGCALCGSTVGTEAFSDC
jgi:predicted RNA-binding Zn-ribbon protein involved in translation (DUF1610 family)